MQLHPFEWAAICVLCLRTYVAAGMHSAYTHKLSNSNSFWINVFAKT